MLPSEEPLARDVAAQRAKRNHPAWSRPRWGKFSGEARQVLRAQNLRRHTRWGLVTVQGWSLQDPKDESLLKSCALNRILALRTGTMMTFRALGTFALMDPFLL